MKLTGRITHSLQADMHTELRDLERAVATRTRDAGRGLKTELRRQVASAGLGQRLANSWRDRHYPTQKLDAASLVWVQTFVQTVTDVAPKFAHEARTWSGAQQSAGLAALAERIELWSIEPDLDRLGPDAKGRDRGMTASRRASFRRPSRPRTTPC